MSDVCATSKDGGPVGEACCSTSGSTHMAENCPSCGNKGRNVGRITVKALLTSMALQRLENVEYRFCPTRTCSVVYYGSGSVFRTSDLAAPVWQKTNVSSAPVCYCFGHSEDSIQEEISSTGKSSISERITQLIRAGRCACEVKNPQGTCCLGNVSQVIGRLQSDQVATTEKS